MTMYPVLVGISAFALALVARPAAAEGLTGARIFRTLAGNSIIDPSFGCVHFQADGKMIHHWSGQKNEGNWWVRNGLYFSTGQCGTVGCILTGEDSAYVFSRPDIGYSQRVILVHGNYCEKNGIIS